jgi:uncharacterized protein (TIGR02678 family)
VTGESNPQVAVELREAARHLLQHPLTCGGEDEPDRDMFVLIRRHEHELDRWFTQRLGYRLHVGSDTARLYKSGYVPQQRPLRTSTGRAFHQLDYTMLALVLGCVIAGPAVISLRHLVDAVRSAAAEAGVTLTHDAVERRALVSAVNWMIARGMATELHEHVAAYADDETSDAVLRIRPERVTLVPSPALIGAARGEDVLDRADRRSVTRQWLRCRLVEDAVLYRDDLDEAEWAELRRRLGEERAVLDEMFGLHLESRAEGLAAIDDAGGLSDRQFPGTGTVSHAALLLIEALVADAPDDGWWSWPAVTAIVADLAERHQRRWANDYVRAPARLAIEATSLLADVRLAELRIEGGRPAAVRLLPAALRFALAEVAAGDGERRRERAQPSLL